MSAGQVRVSFGCAGCQAEPWLLQVLQENRQTRFDSDRAQPAIRRFYSYAKETTILRVPTAVSLVRSSHLGGAALDEGAVVRAGFHAVEEEEAVENGREEAGHATCGEALQVWQWEGGEPVKRARGFQCMTRESSF